MLHKVLVAVAYWYHTIAALFECSTSSWLITWLQGFLDKLEPELAARLTAVLGETSCAAMLRSRVNPPQ